MSFVWIFLWLTASCKKGQRKRTKKEKCWTAIKGGKLGEEVCSIRGNSITGMFCTSLYIWKLQIGKLRLVRLKLCENLLPWNIIVTQHGKRLVLLGVTCIFFFLILKFLNRLKCFWLSIQVNNSLYCFDLCNFCHPRTIWNFCDFSWRLKLSGVNCTESRFYRPFLLSCAQRYHLETLSGQNTVFSDLYEIVYLTLNLISLCLLTGAECGKGLLSLPPLLKNSGVNIS